MSTPKHEITLYFDLVSSFSYLAFSALHSHPLFTQKNVKVTFTPVSIGVILKKSGNAPPIIPGRKSAKQDYIVRDFARRARVLNVSVLKGLPKGFPGGFDTRPILKILLVIQKEFPEEVYVGAVQKFYHALWKDGVDFTSPDISKTLIASLELPGNSSTEDILAKAASEEITNLLNSNTQEVLDQGGFGLPWIKATKPNGETDTWWGVDQLTQVAGYLELDLPAEIKDAKIRHML